MTGIVVPFRRELKLGSTGTDVVAVKRALHKLGGYWLPRGHPITPVYGPFLKLQMRRWQKHHMKQPGDGSYGHRTHRAFLNRNAYDAYGAWLMKTADWQTPEQKRRGAVVRAALYGAANEPAIHYTQGSQRMSGVRGKVKPPSVPAWEDCSSFATWCYWLANDEVGEVPDPNGLDYDGYGFTGTMISHGWRVGSPEPGDLCFYGSGSIPSHVTIAIGAGKCVSHGAESGPKVLSVNYRGDLQQVRAYIR
jgi:cell wall-associated NlpC family hydrolase